MNLSFPGPVGRLHGILWTLFHWYWSTFESVREEYAGAL